MCGNFRIQNFITQYLFVSCIGMSLIVKPRLSKLKKKVRNKLEFYVIKFIALTRKVRQGCLLIK
jgi:hypothetical protein